MSLIVDQVDASSNLVRTAIIHLLPNDFRKDSERVMNSMEWYVNYLGLEATEDQLVAGRFLESRGQRFCCEFGILNAVEKADAIFDQECEKIRIQ